MTRPQFDVVIFGAGIAGLWTLARLRAAGFRVVLFEKRALGGVQSIASQGIIHGGTKYALTGRLTGSAMTIGAMPGIWRAALAGQGEVDLRGTRLLSPHQYLWSTGSLASGVAGFFAGKVMQSRMESLAQTDFPPPFDTPAFRGSLYRLAEPVLDPASLMIAFEQGCGSHCLLAPDMPDLQRTAQGWTIAWSAGPTLSARAVVLAAGRGNAELLHRLGRSEPAMQLRPLHMLMLRGTLPPLHAHCLGASASPRLTVTSYPLGDGRQAWYLGGQIAEEGVQRDRATQITAGQRELAELLPWVRLDEVDWATLEIERAEVAVPGQRRPDDAFVGTDADALLTCWPTKLAFAPRVAQLVLDGLAGLGITPTAGEIARPDLPRPPLATLPWEAVDRWN